MWNCWFWCAGSTSSYGLTICENITRTFQLGTPTFSTVKSNPWTANLRFWDQNFNEDTRKFDVPFYFKSDFDESRKDKIRIKLAEFARDTCVQMVEVSQGDSAFSNKLEIQQERGCSSYVGRHYAYQMLSLAPGCENSYIPLHEVRSLEFHSKLHYAT